ncbi:WD40 repeat domain-containing protein [Embleya sp. NPDC020630]|uniref:WD40 repeat domain-containing protein n=1 Tax=Embleya sp. NPDC020630 TaxID=3363979 RepID=UPI0037B54B50
MITAFAARRLLVTDGTGVEIAHDVLLTSWHQLTSWLEGDRLDRALHSRLLTDTTTWLDHHKHKAYLYPAARLAEARAAADRWRTDPERYPQPTADATEFLLAGRRTARRGTRLRHTVMVVLATLTATAMTLAVITYQKSTEASLQHAIALSRQLAAESLNIDSAHPVTARRLAAAAWHAAHTDQARNAMTRLLDEQQRTGMLPVSADRVSGVAFSPDGNLLATVTAPPAFDTPRTGTGTDTGTVGLWDVRTRTRVGDPIPANPGGTVFGVAFSPDGSLLTTAIADRFGTVTVGSWDVKTRTRVGDPIPADPGGDVFGVAFSPDGNLLATATADGTIYLARVWSFTDMYAALCSDVGAPTSGEWEQYVRGEPLTGACGS